MSNDFRNFYKNAVNRTLTKTQKKQRELIKESLLLKDKTIKRLSKARRANQNQLRASIRTFVKIELSPNVFKKKKERKGGIEVAINKDDKVFLEGAFYIKPRKGGRAVVSRNPNNRGFRATKASIKSEYTTKDGVTVERVHKDLYYLKTKKGFFEVVQKANDELIKELPKMIEDELKRG